MADFPTITTKARNDTVRAHDVFVDGEHKPAIFVANLHSGNVGRQGYAAFVKMPSGEVRRLVTDTAPGGSSLAEVRRNIAKFVHNARQRA